MVVGLGIFMREVSWRVGFIRKGKGGREQLILCGVLMCFSVGKVVFGGLGQPNLYYLKGEGNVKTPTRNFVREELQVVL